VIVLLCACSNRTLRARKRNLWLLLASLSFVAAACLLTWFVLQANRGDADGSQRDRLLPQAAHARRHAARCMLRRFAPLALSLLLTVLDRNIPLSMRIAGQSRINQYSIVMVCPLRPLLRFAILEPASLLVDFDSDFSNGCQLHLS
jgi:hypothetical protein